MSKDKRICVSFNTDYIDSDKLKELFTLIDCEVEAHGVLEADEKDQHIFFRKINSSEDSHEKE